MSKNVSGIAGLGVVASLLVLSVAPSIAGEQNLRSPDWFGFTEVRVGALAHQIEDSPGENGVDLNLEILFTKLPGGYQNRIIEHFLTPRPHVGASINLEGDTSQLYFGLTWEIKLTDKLFFETSFGGAAHNGPHDEPKGSNFGCTFNFRESASIGYEITPHWNVLLTIDHMSNAGLCDENRGLTNAGIRIGYEW